MGEQPNPNLQSMQEIEALTARLIASQKNLFEAQVILSDRQDRTGRLLEQLADHALKHATQMAKIDEVLIRLGERVDNLAASQAHSDARLDALVAVVDDLVPKNGGRGNAPLQ